MMNAIYIRVNPKYVHYINRIMEGYEYLGTVSTINRAEGIVIVRVTPDTLADVKDIIDNLDIPFEYVKHDEIIKN
ncbi:DUF4911 domain-containing protein [Dendrosporobacter sp. 1207_IL3150]|uniref:DUF4911 domain-containing protein n=1 Tax=Dendrosporobacter sp. 1207_IL3150 TaxID=3084054 RepID=UPI002FD93D23